MQKTVIVINGAGGVGKDTLCKMAENHYAVKNISSIDPIKAIAAQTGWKGEKTDKARKFLADLKQLTIAYNDYPLNWLKEQYELFLKSEYDILFVHIREPKEIAKFVEAIPGRVLTLLVRGGKNFVASRGGKEYGNAADDEVEQYTYDYYFLNDHPLSETDDLFYACLKEMLGE